MRRAPGRRPFVYGHRGASARAPENTLKAFALALDEGADGIELDVRLSRDGVVVVVHDVDLARVAGRPDRIAALDAATLRTIDVGGDVVPTLDDTLDLTLPRGARVNVELKGDVPDRGALTRAVARLLARRHERERDAIFVSSFRPEILIGLRALRAAVPRAFLFDAEHTGPMRAALLRRAVSPEGLHPHHTLCSPGAIARWHARGLFVNAWTVDAPGRARALAEAGIDGLITNDPAGICEVLEPGDGRHRA
ncbi:MAG: glycerophosphodiester phosphodiesterase [Myxococcota bacterium]|nr:glycerophosphodiester phosphodiesterase [Myxococcota bacterium]